jgi:parallel beta-helix repeat protein
LTYSTENSIINNTIFNNVYDGIRLIWSADNNIITSNTISNNDYGIHIIHSNINTINNNTLVENSNGIFMEGGNEDTVIGNTLSDNWAAISFSHSSYDNVICHNNFFNNTHQIGNPIHSDPLSSNRWDNGLEGNYWSDYTGQDANLDGIGDTPYIADGDNYPLMGMFSDFTVWDNETYHITTICNFTISGFNWGYSMNITGTLEKALYFNVFGPEDTVGFCRIMIPRAFLEGPYTVLFTNEVNSTELPISNSTHVFLYITYNHSGHVMIVPDFSTWTSMLLILIVLTVTIAIYKRRLLETPKH